jgi:hypothetical protein
MTMWWCMFGLLYFAVFGACNIVRSQPDVHQAGVFLHYGAFPLQMVVSDRCALSYGQDFSGSFRGR